MSTKDEAWRMRLAKWFEKIDSKEYNDKGSRRGRIINRTLVIPGFIARTDGIRATLRRIPDDKPVFPEPEWGFEHDPYAVGQIAGVCWTPGMAGNATNRIPRINAKFLRDAIPPEAKSVYISGYSPFEPVVVAAFDDYELIALTTIMPLNFRGDREDGGSDRVDKFLADFHAALAEEERQEQEQAKIKKQQAALAVEEA